MKETLRNLLGQKVVVDTRSAWTYLGTLTEVHDDALLLTEVDVHEAGATTTPKEIYIHDSRATGIKANRKSAYVNLEYVVSVSLLADVIKF